MVLGIHNIVTVFLAFRDTWLHRSYHGNEITPPQVFQEGDRVDLKVNSLTSSSAVFPINNYRLAFCQPEGGPKPDHENLGQILAGDTIESSPFQIYMKKDMYCQQLCVSNLGVSEKLLDEDPNHVVKAIRNNYHNNWIIDNLNAASKVEDEFTTTTRYWQGFPVGFIGADGRSYVHNHMNLEIQYHPDKTDPSKFRIVRFTVEPFSIDHKFEALDAVDIFVLQPFKIVNAIESCKINSTLHTNFDMATRRSMNLASGQVLFTYDVIWTLNREVDWPSRWDVYLTMDDAIPDSVHYSALVNNVAMVFTMSVFFLAILSRRLKEARSQSTLEYNALATSTSDEENVQTVVTSVWLPPTASLALAVCCGTGAQLLLASLLAILLAARGLLGSANRGSLLLGFLLLCLLMTFVGGYVTARLHKTFGGECWKTAGHGFVFGFPTLVWCCYLIFYMISWHQQSTFAIPLGSLALILSFWFSISSILGYGGAYLGNSHQPLVKLQVNHAATTPHNRGSFLTKTIIFGLVAGLFSFCSCFVEPYFVMNAIWFGQYYYPFAFLLLCTLAVVVLSAEIAALFIQWQLRYTRTPAWWWSAFFLGGSPAVCMFLYACLVFSKQLELSSTAARMVYAGYMGLFSFGIFLMLGFVGLVCSLCCNMVIFKEVPTVEE